MEYYKFYPAYRNKALSIGGDEKNDRDRMLRFLVEKGVKVNNDYPSLFDFKLKQIGKEYDLLANSIGWLIVSERFVSACDDVILANMQLIEFPITTLYNDGQHHYYIVNVLHMLKGILDVGRSDVIWAENDVGMKYISSVYKPFLWKDKIPEDIHIFRIEECWSSIFISQHMKDRLKTAKVTGYEVKPI